MLKPRLWNTITFCNKKIINSWNTSTTTNRQPDSSQPNNCHFDNFKNNEDFYLDYVDSLLESQECDVWQTFNIFLVFVFFRFSVLNMCRHMLLLLFVSIRSIFKDNFQLQFALISFSFCYFSLLFLFIIIQFIHSFIYRLLLKGLKNSTLQFYKKKKKNSFLLFWYFTTSVYWFLLKINFLCYIWKLINYYRVQNIFGYW